MASVKPATRYVKSKSLNSLRKSDPSSSADYSSFDNPRALAKKNDGNQIKFSHMVKKLVENKEVKNLDQGPKRFVIASDILAEDLKKGEKKSGGLSALQKKLFKGSKKTLAEVTSNTRTVAMVLRNERELLNLNNEQQEEIAELNILLQDKNREVERLKDLCLKQREEIKSLKTALLFPDQFGGSEIKQAKQLIPSLQRQVTSLTGQIQNLAEDLAQVKAYGTGFSFDSPTTPSYHQEDADNFLFDQEYSSSYYPTLDSPDHMFLNDLNPCLTPPYSRTKSKEFDAYDSPAAGSSPDILSDTFGSKMSTSSGCSGSSNARKGFIRAHSCSGDSRCTNGKQMHQRLF